MNNEDLDEDIGILVVEVDGYKYAVIKEDGTIIEQKDGEVAWSQKGKDIKGINSEGESVGPITVGDAITGYDPQIDEAGTTISGEKASLTSSVNDNGYSNQTFSLENESTEWIALGAEKGQLIITTKDVVKTTTTNDDKFSMRGAYVYVNGIKELNKISKLYGQGKYADWEKTRSINVEDINKVTGYNPMKGYSDRTGPYGKGILMQYGNKVTYSWDNGNVKYQSSIKNGISEETTFQYPNAQGEVSNLETSESKSFTSDYYYYYPESLTTSSSGDAGTVRKNTTEYNALFITKYYWLGSQYVSTYEGRVIFGLRYVNSSGYVGGADLFYSNGIAGYNTYVRPAVFLKSNVKLTSSDSSGWVISI